MKRGKLGMLWRIFAVVAATAGFAGCAADGATAPDGRLAPTASTGLLGELLDGPTQKSVLTRKASLDQDITVSKKIGAGGGTIEIPGAGFSLRIPRGAVSSETEFRVTAVAGPSVAYEFEPHGIRFAVPLVANQDLSGTDYRPLHGFLTAGYFADRSQLDLVSSTALVTELINGLTLPLTKQFYWPIRHFSGYIVAW